MWEGISVGCSAGLTLKRCSQLAIFTIQPVGSDAAAALWLAEDGVPRCASSELQFGALREVVARERQGALSRRDW